MTYYLLLFILAILPVCIILYYIYKGDRKKEPKKLLFKLFMFGILSCFITLFLSSILSTIFPFVDTIEENNIIENLFAIYIGVALIEEFSKWIMVYFIGYKSSDFDESYDILIYSVFVSLGFACFENITYVLSGGIMTGIMRALLAVPGHAFDAVFMGYYLGLAKNSNINNNIKEERKYKYLSILMPMLLHGTYDFPLMTGYIILVILFFVFIIILYVLAIKKIRRMSKDNKTIIFKNKYCPECGTKVIGEYCSTCGYHQE